MSDRPRRTERPDGHRRALRASVVSVACLLRALPLFFRATPRTPLRVLGIVALDTLHVLRHARLIPREKVGELALFLDFEGCVNAAWDRKDSCEAECDAIRRRLEAAGLGSCVEVYLGRLRALESRRPPVGGDQRRFHDVRAYREAVARLSMATAAAVALNASCSGEDIRAAGDDRDVDTLFRILMQCQIIDDVMDYRKDLAAGLPSFLTACASLPRGLDLTAMAVRSYAAGCHDTAGACLWPLRVALGCAAGLTTLVVGTARWRLARQSRGRVRSPRSHRAVASGREGAGIRARRCK